MIVCDMCHQPIVNPIESQILVRVKQKIVGPRLHLCPSCHTELETRLTEYVESLLKPLPLSLEGESFKFGVDGFE